MAEDSGILNSSCAYIGPTAWPPNPLHVTWLSSFEWQTWGTLCTVKGWWTFMTLMQGSLWLLANETGRLNNMWKTLASSYINLKSTRQSTLRNKYLTFISYGNHIMGNKVKYFPSKTTIWPISRHSRIFFTVECLYHIGPQHTIRCPDNFARHYLPLTLL